MTVLQVDDVHVRAGATVILTAVSLALPRGGIHAITGPNGAGKTTLLHTIAGNIRPTAGRILLAGKDITGITPHRAARLGIARTWQRPSLIGQLSVAANIELVLRGPDRNRRCADLLAVHDLHLYAHLPAARLPYGTQRRAEFAAAIAAQPLLLLLDEPTAGLSDNDIDALRHHLRQLPPATTVLLADHNQAFVASVADSIHVMRDGKLSAAPAPIPKSAPAAGSAVPQRQTGGKAVLQLQWPAFCQSGPGTGLTVHQGQIVVVTGPNGAGKTTLLETIAGLRPLNAPASIRLHGETLPTEPASLRARRGIGYTGQASRVFSELTVGANLAFAAPGWETTPLGQLTVWRPQQKAATLSGGEQQILALTRTLSRQHHLVMLDEPFEGLAPSTAAKVQTAIAWRASHGTAILITDTDPDRPYLPEARYIELSPLRPLPLCRNEC